MKTKDTSGVKFFRVFEPLIWEKRITIEANIAYLLRGLLPVIGILFTKYLISIIETGNTQLFQKQFFWISGITLLYFVLRFSIINRGWVKGFWIYQKAIRTKYLKKILYIENNHYDKIGTGNLISIVEKGVQSWATFLVNIIRYSRGIIITFIINIYFLSALNIWYPIIFMVFIVIFIFIGILTNKTMNEFRNERREVQREGTRRIVRLFMTKFDILQNNKIGLELDHIARTSDKAVDANKKMGLPTEVFFLGPQIVVYIGIICIFYYGGNRVMAGTMSFAFFYGIISALFLLQGTLDKSLSSLKDMAKDRADLERLWSLADNSPEIIGIDIGKEFVLHTGKIVFSHVDYGYDAGHPILNHFDICFEGGKKTALVGISGAGKSTIIKLIAGYIHATGGVIYIDDQQLPKHDNSADSVSLKSYYKHIGYLTQEPNVFDGSVYDNLVYALDHKPSQESLDQAIVLAQCQFVYKFPHGLDTEIGEKGIRLSGGQRQRLAIAKIFLKNPGIVLLDEPTSALDSLSEEAITKALDALFEGRTVIIIAHRLQTVKKADDIIVIEQGEIIERGTHDQLTALQGQYAKMLELQSGF